MNKWMVAITVMLPMLIVIVDTTVVNVSLDHIRGSLSAGIEESTWVITSFLASTAVVIPMSGWVSRLFGRKRYLIFSIALFTFSSIMCGSSWNIQSLVFFRVLQGIGGGALQPISQAILLESFPPHQHGIAMAIFGIGTMFGPIIGPLLGGWITDNWSWRWAFYVNIPIGIVSILMALFFIVDPPYMERKKMKIDYWGLLFLVMGVACLQIVLDKGQREEWFSSSFITWLSFISVSSLVLFVLVECFAEHPILNLRTFKNRSFLSGNVVAFLTFFGMFSSIILLPIYLQTLMGYTAFLAGLVLAPPGIASIIFMGTVGKLVTRINPKVILAIGIAVLLYAFHLMSQLNLSADFKAVLWPRIVMGVGMGIVFVPLTILALSSISKEEMGNATSIFNLQRNLAGSSGVAILTTILARRAQFHQAHIVEHLNPFDRNFQLAVPQITQKLQDRGFISIPHDKGALSSIYGRVIDQATMMSFNDVFYILTIMFGLTLLIVLLMPKAKAAGSMTERIYE
jgi:DHA2 family multidrug resistance protein